MTLLWGGSATAVYFYSWVFNVPLSFTECIYKISRLSTRPYLPAWVAGRIEKSSPNRRQQVQRKKLRFLCGVSHLSSYSDFNSRRVLLISAAGPSRNSSASMCDTLKPNPLRSDEFSREWELMEESSPASPSTFYSWVSWKWRSAKKLWWDFRCQ